MSDDNDASKKDHKGQTSSSNEAELKDKENWRNEHGNPSFEFLNSLEKSNSPDALEKLKSIAQDLDVEYNPGMSREELIDSIRLATGSNPNTTS